MANNYVEASWSIDDLTADELAWWKKEALRECPEDMDPEDMEVPISNDWTLEDKSVWFTHDESIDVDSAASVIQRFLKEARPEGSCGFCWAETCSKPRLDNFGGGACFITAEKIEWNSAAGWAEQKETAFKQVQACPTGHDLYCAVDERMGKLGHLVYCADCEWTAEGATEQEAWAKWEDGTRIKQEFDRSEIVG